MEISNLPKVVTPEEIAEYLKVDINAILTELEKGNIIGFKVGEDWRSTEELVIDYINQNTSQLTTPQLHPTNNSTPERANLTQIPQFEYRWPASTEQYVYGYETQMQINGHEYTFKIGFTEREAAGQLRTRVVVWRDNWPLVEFAGGNNFANDGLLASIIKLKNGKQLRSSDKVPNEYSSFQIARYNSIVQGPHASRNMAIVVKKDDFDSMLRHAIIRGKWKGLL